MPTPACLPLQIAVGARVLDNIYKGVAAPNLWTASQAATWAKRIGDLAVKVKKAHYGVYLGFGALRRLSDESEFQPAFFCSVVHAGMLHAGC